MGLDAVELIMKWEDAFGVQISDDEAEKISTPEMAIDLISEKLGATDNFTGVCLAVRAYYRWRKALCNVLGLPYQEIKLDTKLRDILPKNQYREIWKSICWEIELPESPPCNMGGVFTYATTIRNLVDWTVGKYPYEWINLEEGWTRCQVGSVVRAIVRDICDVENFKDSDDFYRVIGIS